MNAKDNSRTSFDRQAATYDFDRNEFPRPVAIVVLRHDGIATLWMTTSLSSEKVKHLRQNPKEGIILFLKENIVGRNLFTEDVVYKLENGKLEGVYSDRMIFSDLVQTENSLIV